MNQDAKVVRFVSKLNPPIDTRLQSLRLTTFSNVLDAGKPVKQEINRGATKDSKSHPPKENAARETPARRRGSLTPLLSEPWNQGRGFHLICSRKLGVNAYA